MTMVPFRKTREKRRRPPLDQAQVVRAALALLDEVGLDDLTMRRLAERLGVRAALLVSARPEQGRIAGIARGRDQQRDPVHARDRLLAESVD